MDRVMNREILRLSLPSILANITVPLVGMVDTAVAGHLAGGEAAAFIGAISVGAMLFNLLYWNFGFLRVGTGGLTAQSFGRDDMKGCALVFSRGIILSIAVSAVVLALQRPFLGVALLCMDGSSQVETLSSQYFLIRIWAAPATLSLMTFSGWFVGMQDTVSSMWKDLIVNGVNIAASVILGLGVGDWQGMGFAGVALGTVIAQYCGLAYCIIVMKVRYAASVFSGIGASDLRAALEWRPLRSYFRMNLELFGRSVCFILIYIGYTMIAASDSDMTLACSSIMMQLLMLFSYFTDGFAYAGEALSGRFLGSCDRMLFRRSVRYVFVWSMAVALFFIGVYSIAGVPILRALTDDPEVLTACTGYLPWLILMPPLGCAAFTWDGVYAGATASRDLFLSMLGSVASFCLVWFVGKSCLNLLSSDTLSILLAAYFAHLLFRTVWMSLRYRRSVLGLFDLK